MFFEKIEGSQLSSVVFIRDYMQFIFEGENCHATLTAFTLPTIEISNSLFQHGSPNYCDTICSLINVVVKKAEIFEGEAISVLFSNNYLLRISLREENYKGPEAATFRDNDTREWGIW